MLQHSPAHTETHGSKSRQKQQPAPGQWSQPPPGAAAPPSHKDELPLNELPDDCLCEVYKRCGDSSTKRSLRHVCQATYSSPTINSLLHGTSSIEHALNHDLLGARHLASLCLAFPKHATLKSLRLRVISSFGSFEELPCPGTTMQQACAQESCRARLSTVEELCLIEVRIRTFFSLGKC